MESVFLISNDLKDLTKWNQKTQENRIAIGKILSENINPQITKNLINLLEDNESTDTQIIEELKKNIYKLHVNSIDVLEKIKQSNLPDKRKKYIIQQISV